MTKLPIVSSRDLIKYFERRGFLHSFSKGSHHALRKQELRVIIPERKEIDRRALLSILNNAGIGRDEFIKDFRSKRRDLSDN